MASQPEPRSRWTKLVEPQSADQLATHVRAALCLWTDGVPEEYQPGRFALTIAGVDVCIIVADEMFPFVRFDHLAVEDVRPALRQEAVDFANALHGRSSTAGVRWWLGDNHLWQCGTFDGEQFTDGAFDRYVGDFAGIARDRTSELRARFGGAEETVHDGNRPGDATS